MEENCTGLLDLILSNEAQNIFLGSPWEEESILSQNDKIAAADDDERDVQDLFDGVNPEVNNNDDDATSESECESVSPREAKEISDEKIKNLRVKELNKLLRNIPSEEAAKIRKRRRNLKNRGYALSCRLRKQREYEDLINENILLKKQLEDGKWKFLKVWNEKEAYKKKYAKAKRVLAAHNQKMEDSLLTPCR